MNVELPLECTHPAAQNTRGMRLFAVHCVRMLGERIKYPQSWESVRIAEQFAKGMATAEELIRAHTEAQFVAGLSTDYVDAACAACSAYRAEVPVTDPESPEAAALFAARVASSAVRLILMQDNPLVDRDIFDALKRYVPELFREALKEEALILAG